MRVALVLVSFLTDLVSSAITGNSAYTIESWSNNNGKACITDCINGKCWVSYSKQDWCTPGSTRATTYFTTGERNTSIRNCRSKCVFAGYAYSWCMITDDDWDYCSVATDAYPVFYQYTVNNETCKTECHKGFSSRPWCYKFDASWDYCNEMWYLGESAKSIFNEDCNGDCYRHYDNKYHCFDSDEIEQQCAPSGVRYACPARPSGRTRRAAGSSAGGPPGTVFQYRDYVENNPDGVLNTVTLSTRAAPDTNNPVLDYTYRLLPGGLRIPYRIRSRILPRPWHHMQATASRTSAAVSCDARTNCANMGMQCNSAINGNDDQCGHLVPYILGGPAEWYNIVPQTRRINTGTTGRTDVLHSTSVWRSLERFMQHWVRGGGSVELEILVVYDLWVSTRPTGFGAIYKFYNGQNGNLVHDCNGYWYSNDPTQDPDDWNR